MIWSADRVEVRPEAESKSSTLSMMAARRVSGSETT